MGTRTAPNTATISQGTTIPQLVAVASTRIHALIPVVPLSTHPLLSIVAATYVLGLLYLPRYLLSLLFSPVAVSTLLLLATLLHFGASTHRPETQTRPPESHDPAHSGKEQQQLQHLKQERQHLAPSTPRAPLLHKPVIWAECHHFAELSLQGPLEVIYEESEEDEDEEKQEQEGVYSLPGCCWSPGRSLQRRGMEGVELLGVHFCPDWDHGSPSERSGVSPSSSSGWDSPENMCFRWELDEEGLIEISLEEDNLIEIDLSACH